jgi:hypothetical protein
MKGSIAAELIRDEPTTIKRCADDIACASVLPASPEVGWYSPDVVDAPMSGSDTGDAPLSGITESLEQDNE